MTVSLKNNPGVVPSMIREIQEYKDRMQGRTSSGNIAFDEILKNIASSPQNADKDRVSLFLFMMKMQMNERLFHVINDDRKDVNINSPSFGLLNMNVNGYLPERQTSKIQHQPQKNDDNLPLPQNDIDEIINHASDVFQVDPDLIRGVIKAESNFNTKSTSPKGAMGLMQLMPSTARDLGVKNPYDPYENVMGGTRYLKGLLDRYGGDVDRALAAYNWGMGNVERYPSRLPRETRTYISRIKQYYFEAKA